VEFRCSQCDHLGEAEEIRATDRGTEVVCAECGHGELLEASSSDETPDQSGENSGGETVDRDEIERALRSVRSGRTDGDPDSRSNPLDWDATYEHLVPDSEPGPRCPKCIERVEPDDHHCPDCGLGLSDRELLEPGESSAIVTESLQDFVREEADERWSAVTRKADPETFGAYVEWMTRYGGDEEAIRRIRYFLVKHPEDEAALEALDTLTQSLRSRLAAARAKAESESESFQSDVSQFRRYVVSGLAIFWSLALAVAIYLVFG